MNFMNRLKLNKLTVVLGNVRVFEELQMFVANIRTKLNERVLLLSICRKNQYVSSFVLAEQLAIAGEVTGRDLIGCLARILLCCVADGNTEITQIDCLVLLSDEMMKDKYLSAYDMDTVMSLQSLLKRVSFSCTWTYLESQEVFFLSGLRRT